MIPAPANPAITELKALTSLRFFAAMMIVALHMRGSVEARWLASAPDSLVQGVSFFFVLSGFILTHVYRARRGLTTREFMTLRIARLFPTHLAAILLLLVMFPLSQISFAGAGPGLTALSLPLKVLMVDSLVPIPSVQFGWNGVSWSLSTEMFFYLAFPLLLSGLAANWQAKLALAALCPVAVYFPGWALGMPLAGATHNDFSLAQLGFTNPVVRIFEFVLGMSCYLAWARWIEPLDLSTRLWSAIETASLAAVLTWLGYGAGVAAAHLPYGPIWLWFNSSGSCFLFAAMVMVFASGRGVLGKLLSLRPMVWLGEISFAIYLYHQIVIRRLADGFAWQFGREATAVLLIGAIIIVAGAPGRRFVLALADRLRAAPPKSALAGT